MAILSRRKRQAAHTVSDADAIARYDYLLATVPTSITHSAHESVFVTLPPQQRQALDPAIASAGDPNGLREALDREGVLEIVARQFVLTDVVRAYFTVGGGSVTIDDQPVWIGELVNHESAPINAGTVHHQKGPDIIARW